MAGASIGLYELWHTFLQIGSSVYRCPCNKGPTILGSI